MDISDINRISSKTGFLSFLGGLAENFCDNPNERQADTVDGFLEACASWIMDFSVCSQNDITGKVLITKHLPKYCLCASTMSKFGKEIQLG